MSPYSIIRSMVDYLQVSTEGSYVRKDTTRVLTFKGVDMDRLNLLYVFVQGILGENCALSVNDAKDTAVLTLYEAKPDWMIQAEAHGWTPPKVHTVPT